MLRPGVFVAVFVLGLLAMVGCRDGRISDSGVVDSAAGDAGRCAPPGPYGTMEGSRFVPFTLMDCEGEPYSFYGETEGFCDARLSVVTLAAGWCGPCRVEAEQMQAQLVEAYEPQGVRVLVAVIEDNDFQEPDAEFCSEWRDQYSLTNPIVLDPTQETQIYFPAGMLPAALVVDPQGVIRHREFGVSTGLETLRAALDSLLAE